MLRGEAPCFYLTFKFLTTKKGIIWREKHGRGREKEGRWEYKEGRTEGEGEKDVREGGAGLGAEEK